MRKVESIEIEDSCGRSHDHGEIVLESQWTQIETAVEINVHLVISSEQGQELIEEIRSLIEKYAL
jgi:hypothetical protein